ncbi:MAG: sulfatase-like hydrolase/transferase [Acidobacteria bacterium]|nr:sulfatase-like hydrolase/transferase [Acidobacteriota bacterium]
MNRRNFLLALAAPAPPRPNVIVLFSDDQRFDTIHALGNPAIQTPNLDRLCARGVSFTHARIMGGNQGAVCVPSRAMLMTGQSLYHATSAFAGKRDYHLWPALFTQNGYTSFGTGKWHNGPKLFHEAFTAGGPVMFGGMNDHYGTPVFDYNPAAKYPPNEVKKFPKKSSSELFADSLIGFLQTRDQTKRFCAYVAFTAPHDPRQAPPEWLAKYPVDQIKLPANFLPQHPFDNGELKIRDEALLPWPRTPEAVKKEIADYYALISHLDSQIGRILDALDRSGQAANTIVVFAGDNGLALGQHGLLGKQNLYDHSIRVPLIVAGPGVKQNQRSAAAVYLYDLFPTLCDLAGLPKPTTLDGTSFAPALRGERFAGRPHTYHAYRDFQRAIRTSTHKLIRYTVNGQTTRQLFDLSKDPLEMINLIDDPKQAQRIRALEADLKAWQKSVDDPIA